MANTDFQSVTQYLAAQPPQTRAVLRRLRAIIRKAIPTAEETISYQIPAYKIDGALVIYFAGWKEHVSLYPAVGGLADAFKDKLAPYRVSKGTLRFALAEPLPEKLIAAIIRFRAKEVAARVQAKRAAKKTSSKKR